MKKYLDFMAKYYPEGDKIEHGQHLRLFDRAAAGPGAEAVRRRPDARERHEAGRPRLKDVVLDLALPGMKINTGPNDYRVNKQLQMMRFNGERWELFGPILEDAGPAG